MFTRHSTCAAALSLLAIAVLTTSVATGQRITNNVGEGIHRASDLGRMDPAQEINITVQMKLRDEAAFNKVVDALYDPSSPTFHKWLTDEDLRQYAPPKEQYDAVRKELENHGLAITSVDENSFSIHAHGTTANVESAFNTQIHQFQANGKVFRSNVENVRLSGAAGEYVSAVAGIESHQVHPLYRRALNPRTGQPLSPIPLRKAQDSGGLRSFVTPVILSKPTTFTFTTPGASLPVGVYFGNVYGKDIPNLIPDYTPAELQSFYGLTAAYKKGWNGAGQTIVLLEAYGYPTIQDDANAFFQLAGLPPLSSSNFKIIYPDGQPVSPIAGELTGWDFEIALDVQWAHSIAPGANILVVITPGQETTDFLAAMTYIVNHHLGNVVSDSWEEDLDLLTSPLVEESFDRELTLAAAKGISFQFSTGDSGDNGLGEPIGAPGVPSNSPHATAVGGTSILNNINGSNYETLGWGTSLVLINDSGVLDPPAPQPFAGGSGGGESVYFAKPSWQKGLPGTGRQVPDVSAVGDPYTGVPIVVTSQGQQFLFAGIGGTSLSSPIFTAFWAIANQKAGHSLGQAAPTIAGLKTGLTDALPLSSPTNVTGTVYDSAGATFYSANDLFDGLFNGTTFTSAVGQLGPGAYLAISFGLDSSLTVTKGWDNVTGYGSPNGLAFLNAVAP
jgi:subtilase family serine protease